MVERSTLGILVFSALVLLLTFRDIVLVKTPTNEASQENQQNLNNDDVFHSENNKLNELQDDDDSYERDQYQDDKPPLDKDVSSTSDDYDKKIPSLKIKGNTQTLKFLFCYSCGYRNMFEQYSQLIKSKFPELKIVGENYAPAAYKVIITQILSSLKLVIIGFILFGQNPFTYLNMPTPSIFNWAVQNKLYACLMIFFISNAIETQLITTGAFEIYLNDMQIWSKIQSDRMPHEKELMQILDMNFNFESEKSAAFGTNNAKF